MKKSWRWLAMFLLVLFAVLPAEAKHVRGIHAGNNTPPAPAPKVTPYWTVNAVDQEGKTITLAKSDGSDTEKYKLTTMTKIIINNQPDKLENIQTGMKAESMTVSAGTLSALSLVTVKETDAGGKKNKNK